MSGRISVGRMILGPVMTNTWYVCREPDGQDRAGNASAVAAGAAGSDADLIPVILIDPADAGERIYDGLKSKGFIIERILLTHAHFDHIGGIEGIESRAASEGRPRIPVACLDAERPLCGNVDLNCSLTMGGRGFTIEPDAWLKDGESLEAAGITLRVIATPGHTVGGCSYYCEEAGLVFSGDTLFAGSVGRSDLPTGNMSLQLSSIKERLFTLPDETIVLPGHGEETTIGDEKRYNMYLG